MKRFVGYVAAVLIGVLSNGIAFGNINMPAFISSGNTPITCATAGGVVWNNAGIVTCGPVTTDATGKTIFPAQINVAGQSALSNASNFGNISPCAVCSLFFGSSSSIINAPSNGAWQVTTANGAAGFISNGATDGQMRLYGRDGTTPGVYASGTNVGVSCTVGTLNPATAIVINGIVTHC